MKTIIKGVYIVIIIILSSVISILTSMVNNEITKKQDLKNAHEAFFAGMTDSEKNSAVLLLVRKHEEEGIKKSTANAGGTAEMQFSIENKIQDGTTTQTLAFMMPDEVISLSMPSARLMPEIDMSEAPEKVSVRDAFFSVVKRLMNSFGVDTGLLKETVKTKPEPAVESRPVEKIIKDKPSVDVSSAPAVEIIEKPEIRITLPTGKEAWVGRKFKAEDGNWYIMGSSVCAEQVDPDAKPMYDAKTGEYIGYTIVKPQLLSPTFPVVAKATVESEKAPVVAKPTATKEVNFVPKPETVYVHDQNQKYTLTVRDVGGLMKFPKDVYPNGIQPFYYGKFPRVVLRATVTTDITVEEKYLIFFTRKLVKKVVLLDNVEVFSGGTWYWYLTNDKEGGMKMVRTSDLSKMHPAFK